MEVLDCALEIRSALKEKGFASWQVSVRSRHEAIEITVKDPTVELYKVEWIAKEIAMPRHDLEDPHSYQGVFTVVHYDCLLEAARREGADLKSLRAAEGVAHEIRTALRERGFNSRRVGVRSRHQAIEITVKDLRVDLNEVKQIAMPGCHPRDQYYQGVLISIRYDNLLEARLRESAEFKSLSAVVASTLKSMGDNEQQEVAPNFFIHKWYWRRYRAKIQWCGSWMDFESAEDIAFALWVAIAQGKIEVLRRG